MHAVAPLHFTVVEVLASGDDVEQRGLARAVAADEADALAFVDGEAGAVEKRMEAEGKFGVLEAEQRHGQSIAE